MRSAWCSDDCLFGIGGTGGVESGRSRSFSLSVMRMRLTVFLSSLRLHRRPAGGSGLEGGRGRPVELRLSEPERSRPLATEVDGVGLLAELMLFLDRGWDGGCFVSLFVEERAGTERVDSMVRVGSNGEVADLGREKDIRGRCGPGSGEGEDGM